MTTRTVVAQGKFFVLASRAGDDDTWIIKHDDVGIGVLRRSAAGGYEVLAPPGTTAERRALLRLVREAMNGGVRHRETWQNLRACVGDGSSDDGWD